jgi:hypothetical protein
MIPVLCLLASHARADEVSPWAIPPEGSCAAPSKLRGWPLGDDAPPFELKTGEIVDGAKAELIRAYLPPPFWENRERFLFEGMQLEIGPCFRDFAPPPSFAEATAKLRGRAKLLDDGGLADHVAGLPFAPDSIARDDARAGAKWAWNFVSRWQAGGFRGEFRTVDILARSTAEPYEGEIWKRVLGWRADRAADDYRVPETGTFLWVAGGKFREPFNAREFAWHQYRDVASASDVARTDDLHVYVPALRKVDRAPGTGLDGLFVPSFGVGQSNLHLSVSPGAEEESAALGGGNGVESVNIAPQRSGFEGLELRPQFHKFRVLGVQDVLAPINSVKAAYPVDRNRDFGPYGLSWASDRWDLRRALVLETIQRAASDSNQSDAPRAVLWLDLQTLSPLYYASYDKKGQPIDVGYYVGRWSEDRSDDTKDSGARVIEPVGQAFANLQLRASWRRESWQLVSLPESDAKVRQAVSLKNLEKGR